LFVFAVNVFLAFAIYFSVSKFGKIRIGGRDAKTQFSTFAWFSMLFSAGLGIGLMFYGVGEPMMHFSNSASMSNPSRPKPLILP